MGSKRNRLIRVRVCEWFHGAVVAVGFGTGLNTGYYPPDVTKVRLSRSRRRLGHEYAPRMTVPDVVTVERVIPAPPEKIFELLADPRGHRMIDGSDSVRDPKNAPRRLSLGASFDMAMKVGFRYTMTNEVIEFEEGRRIAWQPRPVARLARSLGGRIWRYELDPTPEGTRVRETWDISEERWVFVAAGRLALGGPGFKFMVKPARTRAAMAATLARIEQVVTRP